MTLREAIANDQALRKGLADRGSYLEGDVDAQFGGPDGKNWLGPRLDRSAPQYLATMQRIRENYLIQNLAGSVVENHVAAVVGKEIDWTLKRGESEAPAESQALTDWYYEGRIQETLQDAVATSLWATLAGKFRTSSLLRLYVPSRYSRTPQLPDALMRGVRVMHVPPEQGGVLRDDDGETIGAYYTYRDGETPMLELVMLASDLSASEYGVLEPIPRATDTVIQIRSGEEYETIEAQTAYSLGGALTMFELSRKPLITEDVLAQQNGHNTQWTYLNRHAGASAFLERVILNGMPPGEWVNEAGEVDPNGTIFKPGDYHPGSGTTNFIDGPEIRNERGEIIGKQSASIAWREPGSSEPILANLRAHREAIYGLVNQLHLLIQGDATASGVSRQQAVQAFLTSTGPTETQTRLAVRWLLKTALMLGGQLLAQPKDMSDYSVDAKVNVHVSDPTAEELRLYLDQHEKGVFDAAELMRRSGIQNPEEMVKRVRLERGLPPLEPDEPEVTR